MSFNNFISGEDPSLLTVSIPPGLEADEQGLPESPGEIGFDGPPLGADVIPGGGGGPVLAPERDPDGYVTNGKLACLRLVHFGDDDPMSEVLCCGKVARGGTKMCWKKDCEVHDHATFKASLPCPMEKSPPGMHVFMQSGPSQWRGC